MELIDIERSLKQHTGGAMFIRPGELAKFLGESKTERVKPYLKGAGKLPDTKRYFIPDVARNIYWKGDYNG